MKKKVTQKELVLFKGPKGAVKLRGDFRNDTLWASQADMAGIFSVTTQNITLHLKKIYKDKELDEGSTCKEFLQVQNEGGRQITRKIKHYNLDVMIAVGYRISSVIGTQFRQWATKTLHAHIVKGYTINEHLIKKNYDTHQEALTLLKSLAPAQSNVDTESVLELVRLFADTWFSLDAYDKENFATRKVTKKRVTLTSAKLLEGVSVLKQELIAKGEATDNFAQERNKESIEGIIGNVMQSFGGNPVYPTLEEKAAHLLYFIIKNHPFVDGNKRTGAYAFVWFLRMHGILDTEKLSPAALTAITLLIAESNPTDKEKMTKLVVLLLAGPKRR